MSRKFIKGILNKVKKLDMAVDTYTKIGKTPAIPYRAFVNLADYLFLTGCIEQSEELLNNAINFASHSSDAFVNLGFLKQSVNDYNKAIDYYKKALKKDRLNTKALCLWGNCLVAQNNYIDAIKKFEKAVEIDKNYGEGYLCWGIALLKKQDYHAAREKFELASKHNSQDARGMFMLASVEIELGMYDEALEKLKFITKFTENNFIAYHNIAYVYFKKKEYEKTIIFAGTALKMAPFKIETYLLLGDTYLLQNKEKEALDIYQQAENMNLKSLFLYLSWGTACQKLGKLDDAIEKFKQGVELKQNQANDELYAKLAKCYWDKNDIDNARVYAFKALEIVSENHLANEIIADILMNEKSYNVALKKLEFCLKNKETKPKALLKMAQCYNALADYVLADKYYEKAVEYDRGNKSLLLEYIEFLISQGNYNLAVKKLTTLEKAVGEELDVLLVIFRVNYYLAKADTSGYNKVKAISVAEKIKEKYPENFDFEDEYNQLVGT